jgi:signal transduction histidine kinase
MAYALEEGLEAGAPQRRHGGTGMLVLHLFQGLAMVLGLVTAIIALRLIRITRSWAAWALIAGGMVLIVAGRLFEYLPFQPAPLTPRSVAEALMRIGTSVLFVVGMALIAPLFIAMRKAQDDLQRGRDELEARVRERTAELERSNRQLAEFAFMASHDLQEPLRKILAFGDRLRVAAGDTLSPEAHDDLDRMEKAAGRMRDLINALLLYSRVTSKAQPFALVDLGRIMREVMSDLEVHLQETAGVVQVGPLPAIEAEPTQMRQLFQNLLGNALKFCRPGVPPRVEVKGEVVTDGASGERWCRLEFRDNGIGFENKFGERIFQVFQRLHARHEYEGNGIGLSICRKIADRHGGTITAQGMPGEGSVFVVTLPFRHGQEETWAPTLRS